ncbi:MAG: TonB-dependent receptor [Deltaproteobacteria bacterium]|nr:TonB-dependent receptor [Deltaproteobacteria bacterium]
MVLRGERARRAAVRALLPCALLGAGFGGTGAKAAPPEVPAAPVAPAGQRGPVADPALAAPVAPPAVVLGDAPPRLRALPAVIPPPGEETPAHIDVLVVVSVDGKVEGFTPLAPLSPALRAAVGAALAGAALDPALRAGAPVPSPAQLRLVVGGPAAPVAVEAPPPSAPDDVGESIEVVAGAAPEPSRGAYDVNIDVHDSLAVPTLNSADVLTLAPAVFLVRTGSDAHPEQIFLRGFDARHGQDIAFSVDGLPLNQVGNPHGHGLVDLHSIIPEVISTMRVMEGPFDPAQGDFAVAGSARFSLGLPEPGLMLRTQVGSFGTRRGVVGWRHREEAGTFVAGEVFRTDGYGQNRAAQRGSLIARLERDAGSPTLHAMAGLYGTDYEHAGVIRRVDVEQGRLGLYDTQDPAQGGRGTQTFLALGVHSDDPGLRWSLDGGLAQRTMGLRDNFTGYLLDDRRPGESDHEQRGDLMSFRYAGRTASVEGRAEGRKVGERVEGVVRAGAYGRSDDVDASARRLRAVDDRAYRTESDYSLQQTNVALFGEGELQLQQRLQLRAGLRAESFQYDLLDRCAAKDGWFPGVEQDDVNCPDEDRSGVIARAQDRQARAMGLAPRGGLAFKINDAHAISAAGGKGIRSLEAAALSAGEEAGFGSLRAAEAAWVWTHLGAAWDGVHRLVGFTTEVDRDLVFDEEQAANVVAGETRRVGALLDSEVQVGGLSARSSATWTRAVFGELPPVYTYYHSDRQEGMLIPYVPPWVVHSNLRYTWAAGRAELGHGMGFAWISKRPLPQSEWSEPIFTVDLSSELRLGAVELGLSCDNVLNRRYALAEYNYASWFPAVSGEPFPTRTPERHISPGAPRSFMLSLTVYPEAL